MAKVTLYEYDGETRHESGVSVNWRQMGEPVEFDPREMSFDERLCDEHPGPSEVAACLDAWHGPWRNEHGHKCYEAETDDRPLYRAEVEE